MKTHNPSRALCLGLLALASSHFAHAGPKVLIDFGTAATFRGAGVTNPDVHGKYWNGINPAAFTADMVDTAGAATTIDLGFDPSGATVNTDSYNGPAGATSAPIDQPQIDAVTINAAALGDLGIKEAVFDYVSSTAGRFQLQGLDPLKRYKLTFYGSAKFQTDNTTVYRVFDDAGFSNELGNANLELHPAASPSLHNQNKTATISDLVPASNGKLYVEFGGSNGNSGKLNAMSVEDSPVAITGPAVLVDFGKASSFRGVDVTSPDINGNHWNGVAPGAYWSNMVNTAGTATTIDLGFSSAVGTDSYNGPAGATSNPVTAAEIAATNIDAASMGKLGIKEAAIDYVVGTDVVFEIAGLSPAKKYNLHFFGSRKFPDNNTTVYSVFDDSLMTNLVAETSLLVGNGVNNNPGSVATVRELTPSAGGALYVKFTGSTGGTGSLNDLAIEEAPAADATAPVIVVTGASPTTVTWGSAYTDAGATATDNVDPIVTVSSSGAVNASLLGSYQITYSATDAAGNNSSSIRTVNVVLPANPTVPGNDGFSPLVKYALGGTGPNSAIERPAVSKVGDNLVLTAIVRTNDPNLAVNGQTSPNLATWTNLTIDPAGVASGSQTGVPIGAERRDFTLSGGDPKQFLRLNFVTTP